MARTAPAASFESLESDLDQKFAYPASSKTYLTGSRPDLRVPLRTILQTSTRTDKGEMANPPIPVYDTSGPYSDPDIHIDLKAGLPGVRTRWIEERGDTEVLLGPVVRTWPRPRQRPGHRAPALRPVDQPAPCQGGRQSCRRCTTRARASSRRKWNTWRCVSR